jgi:hypothetical protein
VNTFPWESVTDETEEAQKSKPTITVSAAAVGEAKETDNVLAGPALFAFVWT